MRDLLTTDEQFFYDQAGYSYDPLTETPDEGRARGATALAAAEVVYLEAHRVARIGCAWVPDPDGSDDGAEGCYIWHNTGHGRPEYLASLWDINGATDDYRRVVRAELASECLDELVRLVAEAKQPA